MQTWWRHPFSALLAICPGNSPVTGEFPTQRPVTGSFDVFFHLHLNKRFSKQSWGWWFETLSHALWRHCNGVVFVRRYQNYRWLPSVPFQQTRRGRVHRITGGEWHYYYIYYTQNRQNWWFSSAYVYIIMISDIIIFTKVVYAYKFLIPETPRLWWVRYPHGGIMSRLCEDSPDTVLPGRRGRGRPRHCGAYEELWWMDRVSTRL